MSRRTRIAPVNHAAPASRPQAPRAPRRPRSTIATSAAGAPSALPSTAPATPPAPPTVPSGRPTPNPTPDAGEARQGAAPARESRPPLSPVRRVPDVLLALVSARQALDDLRRTARDLLLPEHQRAFSGHGPTMDAHFGSVLEHVRAAELELLGVLEAGTVIPLVMLDGTIHGRASDLAPDARAVVIAMTNDPDVLAGRITRALRIAALGAWEDSGEGR